jgi:hypothetical protein
VKIEELRIDEEIFTNFNDFLQGLKRFKGSFDSIETVDDIILW